jgi:hypothetical protein
MARFHIQDVKSLESSSTSPAALRTKIGEMILNSTDPRARVDAINHETGEYRVVLQGTLNRDAGKSDDR